MKLEEMTYSKIIFKYKRSDFNKLIFISDIFTDNLTYDIGILFGGVSMLPNRADEVIKLYKDKLIKKIIVSGGIGFLSIHRLSKEANKLKAYLIKNGIPKKDIIIEDTSRNTFENIVNSINILKEMYDINKIKILLITSDFHLQRCIRLTRHLINNKNIYGKGIKDGKNDLNNWHKHLSSKKNIYVEAFLLAYYTKHHKLYLGELS